MGAMLCVTLSSFAIRELNDGEFSWIHGLTLWTLFSMFVAVFSIHRGWGEGSCRIHDRHDDRDDRRWCVCAVAGAGSSAICSVIEIGPPRCGDFCGLGACAVEVLMPGDWRTSAEEVGSWSESGHLARPSLGWNSHAGRPGTQEIRTSYVVNGYCAPRSQCVGGPERASARGQRPIRLRFSAKHTRSHSPRTFAKPRRLNRRCISFAGAPVSLSGITAPPQKPSVYRFRNGRPSKGNSLSQGHATFMPDAAWAVNRFPQTYPGVTKPSGFDIIYKFSTRHQWFACARLLFTYLTKSRSAFSSTLTTPALYRRSLRRFEAYPCRPTPKDLPSSIAQHSYSRTFINYINTPSCLPWHTLIQKPVVTLGGLLAPMVARVDWAESVTPPSNGFVADDNPTMCQEVLDIAKAQRESVVQEHGVGDNLAGKTKAAVD